MLGQSFALEMRIEMITTRSVALCCWDYLPLSLFSAAVLHPGKLQGSSKGQRGMTRFEQGTRSKVSQTLVLPIDYKEYTIWSPGVLGPPWCKPHQALGFPYLHQILYTYITVFEINTPSKVPTIMRSLDDLGWKVLHRSEERDPFSILQSVC